MKKLNIVVLILILTSFLSVFSQEAVQYMTPPKEIVDLVDAPVTPSVNFSPDAKWMLLIERPSLPSIKELSQPELRIAGHRINPVITGPSRSYHYKNLILKNLNSKEETHIKGLPSDPQIGDIFCCKPIFLPVSSPFLDGGIIFHQAAGRGDPEFTRFTLNYRLHVVFRRRISLDKRYPTVLNLVIHAHAAVIRSKPYLTFVRGYP